MKCCSHCCCCGSKEKIEHGDKAYMQDDPTVITKQPGETRSSSHIELSNSFQHSTNNDAFSGAAVSIGPTRPDSSSKKNKAPIPPAQNFTQTPGPTAHGRNSDGAVQDSQRWNTERQLLEQRYQLETTELHQQLGAMKEQKEKLEKSCQSHLDNARQEKEALGTEIDRIKKENERLQNQNVTYEAELKKTKTDMERVEMEKKDMENANLQLQADLDGRSGKEKKRKELRKLYEDMKRNKEEVEQKLREREASFSELMHSHRHTIQAKEVQMAKLREEKKNLETEKDELLVRLSALAGRKLTDNNPNIADLSDINRPTKLAEKFSELYDNAWTDAFSEVQDIENFKDEEKTVTLLLDLLTLAYNKAMKAAEDQLISLKTTLEIFSGSDDTLVNDVLKQLKDSRKKIIVPSKALSKTYYHALEQQNPEAAKMPPDVKKLKIYTDECLDICWLMAIQDPPLYFHTDGCRKGDEFDKNSFKEYTQGGKVVDFAVWPALYLQKDGSLLAKGVVQCKKMQDESDLEKVTNKPDSESINCSKNVMSKQDNEGGWKTTTKKSLSESRNGEEKTAIIDKTSPVEENFENNANKKRRNEEVNTEHHGSKASAQGFENLKKNEGNAQIQAEKHKLAPVKKEPEGAEVKNVPIPATNRSWTEYKKDNAENTVFVTETNNMKSESDSEIKTSNPVVTRNDSVEPDVRTTSKPDDMREYEKVKNTDIVIAKETKQEMPRNVSNNQDLLAADLKEDTASRSEKQLSKTDLKSPSKNDSNTLTTPRSSASRKATFQSKTLPTVPARQTQRPKSDNMSNSMPKVTVQRNSAPETQADRQKNEPKQTQELKEILPQKIDSKNTTSVDVTSFEAKEGKEPHVSSLVKMFSPPKDSRSDDTDLKQSEAGQKAKTLQGKHVRQIKVNKQTNQEKKIFIKTLPADKMQ